MDTRGPHPSFRDLLRHHRIAAGLSQEKLAERAGLSVRAVSDLERGVRRSPRLETVRMLADALGLGAEARSGLLRAARSGAGTGHDPAPTPAHQHNPTRLPIPPTPLVGREAEISTLLGLLTDHWPRLVTLTGPGGVGKTRLALEVASSMATLGADVHLVQLGSLHDPGLVASAIADVVNVRETGSVSAAEAIEAYVRDRELLLVLDNVEHLIPATPFIARLLASGPGLKILATSRVPLWLQGERQFPVPPLQLPRIEGPANWSNVAKAEAVRLFVDRAREANQEFELRAENILPVAEICRRLDGLPLALELAAVRVAVLSPEALLSRLDRRLDILTVGPSDLPERHQSLRDAIAWSYDVLEPDAQRLFRRLAVFAGGWTLHGAEAVANAEGNLDILEGMTSLVTGCLVRRAGDGVESRFTMLETIHEFGREMLLTADEEMVARKAHGAWMLQLVERAGPELVGRDQAIWLCRLENEVENLRAALAWAIAHNEGETALRLAAAPWLFWFERGRASEGRDWLARALALAPEEISAARAEALYAAGSLAATQADYPRAEVLMEMAITIFDALHDAAGLARARQILGTLTLDQDHNQKAAHLFRQALSGYDVPPASVDAPWVALARSQLAAALSRLGEREQARALATEAVAGQQAAGSTIGVALGLSYLGEIALDWGDRAEAGARFRESLEILRQQGDRWYLLYVLTGLVTVMAYEDPPQRAARLFGAESAARLSTSHVAPPRFRAAYDAAVAHLRSTLGEEAFLELHSEGAMLSLHEALAVALRD